VPVQEVDEPRVRLAEDHLLLRRRQSGERLAVVLLALRLEPGQPVPISAPQVDFG
jgi:hypothetical protein